jgi:DMSO reductase anchor subunit
MMIWLVWWMHFRSRRQEEALPRYRFAIELLGVGIIALTGHLGGFLSGVNVPG